MLVSPRLNPTVLYDHASVRYQSGCVVPLSIALAMRSVSVVSIPVEEVRVRRREAGDAAASVKSGQGLDNMNLN